MGIFSDNVMRLYESGLICIPVGDKKAPIQKNWDKYCDNKPTVEEVERWEKDFSQLDRIGLCMGASSGIVAFDFDYAYDKARVKIDKSKFDKDLKAIESQLIHHLPQTPAIKVGKKGWTRFYKWNPRLTTNISIDRNGVRLFDFLAWHKQTVMPPSHHSIIDGHMLSYKWIGDPIEECLDDIPEIDFDKILEAKMLFGDQGPDESRHGKLFKWLMDISLVEKNIEKLAALLIKKDQAVNSQDPKGPYLSDKKHHKFETVEENAKHFAKRAVEWKATKADVAGREPGKAPPPIGPDVWNYFFENSFHKIKKDIISKKCFFKLNESSDWSLMDGIEGVLRSYASSNGLPVYRTVDELARWGLEKADCDFLCDIPKWDGLDRIFDYGMSVKSPNFTGEEITDILKHWGSNIFRRVRSADYQNRCVILKGPQGVGKDFFVRTMLKDFKPYYESTTMPGTQKDALEIVSRLLAVHIEEFDQTKHMDMAFLKSLITQPSAFFRESYGSSPNQKIMRPSFISTANVDDILRDPTGNRRFIVIPITEITWDYPMQPNSSVQVLAQWRYYFETEQFGKLSDEIEAKIRAVIDVYTPADLSVAIVDMYQMRYSSVTGSNGPFGGASSLSGKQAVTMLAEIAKALSCSLRKVQSSVKGAGLGHEFKNGVRYFANIESANEEISRIPKKY